MVVAAEATAAVDASSLDVALEAELKMIRAQDLYRVRRTIRGGHGVDVHVEGRRCINFCSNDYLGLAADPRPAAAARQVLAASGTGSGAAALVSGYDAEHRALEEALADFLGRPRVLLFSSGWAANLGVLRALLGRGDCLIADELNHASLIDGGRLSRAHYHRVTHADTGAFAAALRDHREACRGRCLIVSDGVFSMDGDVAGLRSLQALARAHEASLMVDDAHGFGVLGKHGRGSIEALDVRPEVHVATLGKALGAAGAFVSGSETLIEYLIQRARSWVFSTAPPPAVAAAAREALRIVVAEPGRRARLHDNIQRFRCGAKALGITVDDIGRDASPPLATPIQPLVLGDSARALRVSQALFERGYWVAAIRPPTVPKGTARLRITLSAAHEAHHIDGLLSALAAALRQARAA